MADDLNDNTIDMYMLRSYMNPQCIGIEEYNDDVSRIKYIKRLLNRYATNGELKEQLLLNHVIIIYNVFGVIPATRILFYNIQEEHWSALKTIMVFLQTMPDIIKGINGKDILNSDIAVDMNIARRLERYDSENSTTTNLHVFYHCERDICWSIGRANRLRAGHTNYCWCREHKL